MKTPGQIAFEAWFASLGQPAWLGIPFAKLGPTAKKQWEAAADRVLSATSHNPTLQSRGPVMADAWFAASGVPQWANRRYEGLSTKEQFRWDVAAAAVVAAAVSLEASKAA